MGLAGFFYCTTSDFFTGYGIALGFTLALLFEEKVVKFSNTKVLWRILLRVIVGGALFLGLNEMLKMSVGGFSKITVDGVKMYWYEQAQYVWFERIFRTLRYSIVVFLLMGVYPMLFRQTEKLWKKWHWLQTDDTFSGRLPKNTTQTQEVNNLDNTPTTTDDLPKDAEIDSDDTKQSSTAPTQQNAMNEQSADDSETTTTIAKE